MALALILLSAATLQAQTDYTYNVPGAYNSESTASYWTKTPSTANGLIQYDTWSGRGSSDGSGMTTPFMEYWVDKTSGTLDETEIRHQTITGLPRGRYQIDMLVRCYAEDGYANPQFNVGLYANEEETSVTFVYGTYSNQRLGYSTASVEFEVGEDGTLDFGLNVYRSDHQNWVAWKNVKLYLLEAYDEPPVIVEGAPAEPGTYYIRNRATGRFIMAGGAWGTAICTGDHGIETTFTAVDNNGNFYLDSGLLNPDNGYHQWAYYAVHGRFYMENGNDNYTFRIVSNGEGYYTIQTQASTYFYDNYDKNHKTSFDKINNHRIRIVLILLY